MPSGLGRPIVTVVQPAQGDHEKGRDHSSRSEFCTPAFPCPVRDACGHRRINDLAETSTCWNPVRSLAMVVWLRHLFGWAVSVFRS
jgi:hypothetical protein